MSQQQLWPRLINMKTFIHFLAETARPKVSCLYKPRLQSPEVDELRSHGLEGKPVRPVAAIEYLKKIAGAI